MVGTYHDGNHGYLKLENDALATVMRALLRDYPINTLPLDTDGLWEAGAARVQSHARIG
jgi:hypothetical protein